jgi:hypothetical protein
MIELYLLIRFLILRPLGLVKPDPNEKWEKDWLSNIGYYEYLKEQKNKKKK